MKYKISYISGVHRHPSRSKTMALGNCDGSASLSPTAHSANVLFVIEFSVASPKSPTSVVGGALPFGIRNAPQQVWRRNVKRTTKRFIAFSSARRSDKGFVSPRKLSSINGNNSKEGDLSQFLPLCQVVLIYGCKNENDNDVSGVVVCIVEEEQPGSNFLFRKYFTSVCRPREVSKIGTDLVLLPRRGNR